MDKRKIKEFTATLSEMLFNKADEEGWGHNDIWNVTEWFVLNSVVIIAIDGIIPREELRKRLERNFHELLDEAFNEVEELSLKKQTIDKACEWWENELTYPSMTHEEIDYYQSKIVAFRKAMEE